MTDFGSMTVEDVLAHHGVKGMKWGVRRDAKTGVRPIARTLDQSRFGKASKKNADRYNTSKAAGHDIKKTKQLARASHKGVVAERAAHKEAVDKKLATNPAYAKAHKRQSSAGRAATKRLLKAYATVTVISLMVNGGPSSRHAQRGSAYMKANPLMMNAKAKDGVYKVTSL